jgi:hypothetical protein
MHVYDRLDQVQTTFYPLNSAASITASSKTADEAAFTVFTRQAFGVSSRIGILRSEERGNVANSRIQRLRDAFTSFGPRANITFDTTRLAFESPGALLEIMMHRNCKRDDGRGLAQPAEDTTTITVPMQFQLGKFDDTKKTWKIKRLMFNNPVSVMYPDPDMFKESPILQSRLKWCDPTVISRFSAKFCR